MLKLIVVVAVVVYDGAVGQVLWKGKGLRFNVDGIFVLWLGGITKGKGSRDWS